MKRFFMALIILLAIVISTIAAIPAYAAADNLVLPQSLEVIQDEAFEGATSLDYVYLREGVTIIGNRAFADSSLHYIFLPYSLEYIAPDAFEGTDPIFDFPEGSYAEEWFEENYANWDQLALDSENMFVPKTKAEMEAEAKEKAEQEANKIIDMPKVS